MTLTKPDIPREVLGAEGRRFHDLVNERTGKPPCCYTMHAGQAAEVLMRAIAASDGTRRSVTEHVLNAQVKDGILGSFGFDRNGDTTLTRIFIHRIVGGELRFDATITPPQSLLGG
jgi:branched-chain amino acid transport system substrate-binding protein